MWRHRPRILFMCLSAMSRVVTGISSKPRQESENAFPSHEQSRASCSLLMRHSALMPFCHSSLFQFLIHFVSVHSSLVFHHKCVFPRPVPGSFIFFFLFLLDVTSRGMTLSNSTKLKDLRLIFGLTKILYLETHLCGRTCMKNVLAYAIKYSKKFGFDLMLPRGKFLLSWGWMTNEISLLLVV